jgi:hypothetical protein
MQLFIKYIFVHKCTRITLFYSHTSMLEHLIKDFIFITEVLKYIFVYDAALLRKPPFSSYRIAANIQTPNS